jgi:predicted nucleic acid-binding protein
MTKPIPHAAVVQWMQNTAEDDTFLSVVTLLETREGIEMLPHGKRKRSLDDWLSNDVTVSFKGRILPIDGAVADHCGRLVATCRSAGLNVDLRDALIASTAEINGLIVVTLNAKDFNQFGTKTLTF